METAKTCFSQFLFIYFCLQFTIGILFTIRLTFWKVSVLRNGLPKGRDNWNTFQKEGMVEMGIIGKQFDNTIENRIFGK